MDIGGRIKLFRKKYGLTQVQLAEKAHISRSYLADVEKNRYNPSIDTLQSISTALGINVSYLLDDGHVLKDGGIVKVADIDVNAEMNRILDEEYSRKLREDFFNFLKNNPNILKGEIELFSKENLDIAPSHILKKFVNHFLNSNTIDGIGNILKDYGLTYSYKPDGYHFSLINKEEDQIINEIESMPQFKDAEGAFKFILEQPQVAAYGGYDLKNMSEEEILEIANDMLFAMKLSIEKMKKKK